MALSELGIASVAGITVICYLLGMIVKTSPLQDKWIPCIVGVAGALLGVIGLQTMVGYPADNMIDAIAVGIVSGLAATGINQMIKQFNN